MIVAFLFFTAQTIQVVEGAIAVRHGAAGWPATTESRASS